MIRKSSVVIVDLFLTLGVGKVSGDVTIGLSSAVLQLLARARAFSNSESRYVSLKIAGSGKGVD